MRSFCDAFQSDMQMIEPSRPIASRGLISILPRFPTTTHAATHRENLEILGEIDVCEHFDDDVVASSVGKREGLFEMVWRAVIKHRMCTLIGYKLPAALGAACTNDVQSGSARQLHGCDSNTAARALNQHSLCGESLGLLE